MSPTPTVPNAGAGARPLSPRLADEYNNKRRAPGAPGTAVITKTKPQTKRPSLYRVLLLNDDYTPMEFVVHVLERFFNKDHGAAHRIMMHVHQHGIGECGIYTYEVAETKVTQIMDFARKHQHPLRRVMEKSNDDENAGTPGLSRTLPRELTCRCFRVISSDPSTARWRWRTPADHEPQVR